VGPPPTARDPLAAGRPPRPLAAGAAPSTASDISKAGMDTAPLSVLLVDDYPDGADALAMLVESFGHPTRVAYSAREARRAVADGFRPDALIVDVQLGKECGYDLARDLCAALVARPLLVAVTGRQGLAEQSRAEGFDHHFLKPTDLSALRRALADHAARVEPVSTVPGE